MRHVHVAWIVILICILFNQRVATKNNDFAIVGYVPEWRFDGIPFNAIIPHVTHLILFSIETDDGANLVELERLPSKEKMKEIRTLCTDSNTSLLVSFGGNGRSNGFPTISVSDTLRMQFVRNTIQFLNEYSLDGIDLNWEYPKNEPEWTGLFKIINLFKTESPEIILTMAFYPGQERVVTSPLANRYNVQQNIELFLMMSYDNMGNRGQSKHSTYEFAKETIHDALKGGIKPEKLALGVPFYARHIQTGDWKTYEEIVRDLREEGMSDYEIRRKNIYKEYYFNGYNMILKKTKYAMKKNIGGVMIWENGQDVHDDPLSLLAALTRATASAKRNKADSIDDHQEL
eukprot:272930_1